ncbi:MULTISPECIES: winged helix DNA-binding domain-containing protein [unclassified Modestobacter]
MTALTRAQVLGHRVRAHQLDRSTGTTDDTAVLDQGVQDTGPEAGRWALAVRGVDVPPELPGLVVAWTLRGAPHLYRCADLPGVVPATAPFSEADAAKRVFDAAKPLRAAGIPVLTALDTVADAMRGLVTAPMVKGEVSGRLAELLPEPYLRWCRPCQATHLHEQPFRLAALPAGLELTPGTSPPVLRPVPGLTPAAEVPEHLDVVRGHLRLYGPATPQHVAAHLDAPVAAVRERWPADAVEVTVDGERRWLLAADLPSAAEGPTPVVRLLGPYDPWLQLRDRPLLVPDPARAKELWPVLGRPGAVLVDGEVAGVWRPRSTGRRLTVQVQPWQPLPPAARHTLTEEAERLAACRGLALAAIDVAG